jgi:hypothetical protein
MYELLAAGRERGGFGFEHWGAPVKLASSPSYAPGSGPLPSQARRVQRFEFVREQGGRLRLAAASQTHPAHPLMIAAQAEDAAGRRGVTRTSVPEARARAIESLCRQAADGLPEAPVVCSEPARR